MAKGPMPIDKAAWGRMVAGTPAIVLLIIIATIAIIAGAKRADDPAEKTVGVAGPALAAVPTARPTGQQLFLTNCAACHGQTGRGGSGKNLVASPFLKGLNDSQAADFIKKGRDMNDPANTTGLPMPAKGGNPNLTDEDLAAVVAFLRSIQE